MEEVGELSRIISRKFGEQSFKSNEKNLDFSDEAAYILWVLICIFNQTGIDLMEVFKKNLNKYISTTNFVFQKKQNINHFYNF